MWSVTVPPPIDLRSEEEILPTIHSGRAEDHDHAAWPQISPDTRSALALERVNAVRRPWHHWRHMSKGVGQRGAVSRLEVLCLAALILGIAYLAVHMTLLRSRHHETF